jgi:hypothetical protein
LLPNTDRYITGPVALERAGVPIPASLIDFSKSPEVAVAKYRGAGGTATLTLIEYPTPQIAGERLRALQSASLPAGPFYFKRSGPILAAVSGDTREADAQTLLASINYDADVTWNEPPKHKHIAQATDFLIAVFILIGIILLIALIFGFAFGGFRMLAKRFFPNRGFDRPDEIEIIRLNLK